MLNATELVWDREATATVTSGRCLLPAGSNTDWAPAMLLATAAGASLLTTFIELARDEQVPVIGFVAQQRVEEDPDTGAIVRVRVIACISVPTEAAASYAQALWTIAVHEAPVLRALGCPVECEPSIVVLSDTSVCRGTT